LDRAEYGKIFDTIYQIGIPENYHGRHLSARATEIINHRGTVEATVHYPDKTVYEKFIALERKCRSLLSASVGSGPLPKVLSMIDSDQNIQKHCMQMQEVAAQLCKMARKGRYSGKVPKSAKNLQKRLLKEQYKLTNTEAKPIGVTQKATAVQRTPEATHEKPKKKRKKNKTKGAVDPIMDVQNLFSCPEKTTKVEIVVCKAGEQIEEVKQANITALRGDVGQLGRVEIVIPSFLDAISAIFGYSR
jgi:hypothetical protein